MPGTRNPRVTSLQFGEAAGAVLGGVGIFGSEAAGAIEYSLNPALIQSLSVWIDGWSAAILGGGNPALEDYNGAFFVFSYMLCYLLRNGIAEWDSGTEYFNGDYVKAPGLGNSTIYVCITSIVGSSVNNPVTDPNNWNAINTQGLNPRAAPALAQQAVGTWVSAASADTSFWEDICVAEELSATAYLIAVASATSTAYQTGYSLNGKSWTGVASASTLTWNSVDYSPSLSRAVAVALSGGGGTVQAMFTPDPSTTAWSTVGVTTVSGQWECVRWFDWLGLFVAVGNSGGANATMWSIDGKTWTAGTGAAASNWLSISGSAELGIIVAVSNSGNFMWSTDGKTWTAAVSPAVQTWKAVKYGKFCGTFVAVSSTGASQVAWSRDGKTWTLATAADTSTWWAIDVSNELGLFTAVANSTTGIFQIMTSPDGKVWTGQTQASGKLWSAIKWAKKIGIFVSIAANGTATAAQVQISNYVKQFIW